MSTPVDWTTSIEWRAVIDHMITSLAPASCAAVVAAGVWEYEGVLTRPEGSRELLRVGTSIVAIRSITAITFTGK